VLIPLFLKVEIQQIPIYATRIKKTVSISKGSKERLVFGK